MGLDRRTRSEVFASSWPVGASHHAVTESVPPHVHDFLELGFIAAGHVHHLTAAGAEHLGPGGVVVVRPGSWHGYELAAGDGPATVTNVYLGSELLHGDLSWVLDYPHLARLLLSGGSLPGLAGQHHQRRISGWLQQLVEEHGAPDTVLTTALLACVLVELARELGTQATVGSPSISVPVRSALHALTGDLARSWTMPELAATVGVSESTLFRQFRAQLGRGPVDWLTGARAERAATLLSQTDLPVAVIGRRVGWADPSYASRRFHRVYGVTPRDYRAAHAVVEASDS